jgi:hypothetical protein
MAEIVASGQAVNQASTHPETMSMPGDGGRKQATTQLHFLKTFPDHLLCAQNANSVGCFQEKSLGSQPTGFSLVPFNLIEHLFPFLSFPPLLSPLLPR